MGRRQSQRSELRQLRETLRRQGLSFREIADHIRREYRVNARVAFRLAHGLTQAEVAALWNAHWPDERSPKTAQHISYWEVWPAGTGRTPSLDTFNRLAYLYQCAAGDLLDGADHRDRDRADSAADTSGAANSLVAGSIITSTRADVSKDRVLTAALDGAEVPEGLLRQLGTILGDSRSLESARQRDQVFEQLVASLTAWAHSMNRRVLLSMLGWAAAAASAAPVLNGLAADEQERLATAIGAPRRVDAVVVDRIEAVLWTCIRQDDTLGPQASLDTVRAQRNLALVMLRECPAPLRPRLLSVFANLSRYAGWLAFDLNDFDSAAYYYEQARTAAHEAQDTRLGALVLCNMSHLATWLGRPRVGIDHAVAAQGWARHTTDNLLQAYASDVAARAYALDGQYAACMEQLGNAQNQAGRVDGADSLVHFYDSGMHASVRGLCMLQLGQTERAIAATQDAVAALDPSFVRNLGLTILDLGAAYIQQRRPVEAAAEIARAAEYGAQNRSARLVQQIMFTRRRLEPWRATAAVRDLDDRLVERGISKTPDRTVD